VKIFDGKLIDVLDRVTSDVVGNIIGEISKLVMKPGRRSGQPTRKTV
jgi:hypothetical protein